MQQSGNIHRQTGKQTSTHTHAHTQSTAEPAERRRRRQSHRINISISTTAIATTRTKFVEKLFTFCFYRISIAVSDSCLLLFPRPHSLSLPSKTHQITQFIFSITCQFVCLMPDYSIRLDSIRFEKGLEKSISFASSKQNVPSLDALTRPLDLRTALKREWREPMRNRAQKDWLCQLAIRPKQLTGPT